MYGVSVGFMIDVDVDVVECTMSVVVLVVMLMLLYLVLLWLWVLLHGAAGCYNGAVGIVVDLDVGVSVVAVYVGVDYGDDDVHYGGVGGCVVIIFGIGIVVVVIDGIVDIATAVDVVVVANVDDGCVICVLLVSC